MKIYFDESGQSGCILQKEDLLNFQNQPTFAIGAIVIRDETDGEKLSVKYRSFLEKYDIHGEIKGTDLLTRQRNDELKWVLRDVFDRSHHFVLLYDKRFYIATLLLLSLLGFEYQHLMPEHFYQQATMLCQQKDDFFVNYLKYIQSPGICEFSKYLHFLVEYQYRNWEGTDNAVKTIAARILSDNAEDKWFDDFMTFGWYDNPKVTNLINLTALSELIYFIKSQVDITNEDITYVHDHIREFEDTIKNELVDHGINIVFADSKQEVFLQIADNLASITRHAYDKAMARFRTKDEWKLESEWDMNLLAHVMRRITHKHISFTVPLCDWAAALCTEIMFHPRYPKRYRNNIHFNYYYQTSLLGIFESIGSQNLPMEEILKLLNK